MPFGRRDLLRSALAGAAATVAARQVGELRPTADGGARRADGFEPDPAGGGLTAPRRLDGPFTLLGVRGPATARVAVRASTDGERWGEWLPTSFQDVESEGPDGAEATSSGPDWRRWSTPVWTGRCRWVQLRVDGADPSELEVAAHLSEAHGGDAQVQRTATHGLTPGGDVAEHARPVVAGRRIVRRHEWGADESLRGDGPNVAERVLHGVVHHTAGTNGYGPDDGPAIVRGIYHFHTQTNGWADIGYNLLIDRFGTIYEGRYGGLDLPVIGAHARGSNTGSFGVALLGDFRDLEVGWPEPREALFEVLAWKFDLHAIDPEALITTYDGRTGVPTLSGHRDVGSTECPGEQLHQLLPDWREGLRERVRLTFSDVGGDTHADNVRALRQAGIAGGFPDGTYRPSTTVTRAQMATFVTRAAQLLPGPQSDFADVAADDPHADGIAAVAAAGIAEGRADGTYGPDEPVTRAQMASFLARALELDDGTGQTFTDVPPTHPHHGAVEAVARLAIAEGQPDGTFAPEQPVTRGQMATFLVRAFELPPAEGGPEDADELDPPDDTDDGDADGETSPQTDADAAEHAAPPRRTRI